MLRLTLSLGSSFVSPRNHSTAMPSYDSSHSKVAVSPAVTVTSFRGLWRPITRALDWEENMVSAPDRKTGQWKPKKAQGDMANPQWLFLMVFWAEGGLVQDLGQLKQAALRLGIRRPSSLAWILLSDVNGRQSQWELGFYPSPLPITATLL